MSIELQVLSWNQELHSIVQSFEFEYEWVTP